MEIREHTYKGQRIRECTCQLQAKGYHWYIVIAEYGQLIRFEVQSAHYYELTQARQAINENRKKEGTR